MLGVNLQWTSIPLHATETGISTCLTDHLADMQTLPYHLHVISNI